MGPKKKPKMASEPGTEPEEKPQTASAEGGGLPPPRLDCMKSFNALWFCYTPWHQMQNYYRYGEFDNCFRKWGDLVDCLKLKTKPKAEVEAILIAREKAKPQLWTYRTIDESAAHWWRMYRKMVKSRVAHQARAAQSAAPPPNSGGISQDYKKRP